jgi:pimeloyl-ACP methyl ester carboxylesterase
MNPAAKASTGQGTPAHGADPVAGRPLGSDSAGAPAPSPAPWRTAAEALLTTADGVRIHAEHRPYAPDPDPDSAPDSAPDPAPEGGEPERAAADAAAAAAGSTAIVVVHGFTGAVERPAVRRAVAEFRRHAGVVTFSMRGHGRSGGRSTVGAREVLDLDAAVGWARSLGYRRIVTVGFSLGGAVAVRHAAVCGEPGRVSAVAAVSAPARWYYRGKLPMRRLHWVVMRPLGRVVGRRGLKTRIDAVPWPDSTGGGRPLDYEPSVRRYGEPLPPTGAAALLPARGVRLLVVHGDADPYFPLDHPRSLVDAYDRQAAGGPAAELWIEHGFGHAENAAPGPLLERIGRWLAGPPTGAA